MRNENEKKFIQEIKEKDDDEQEDTSFQFIHE